MKKLIITGLVLSASIIGFAQNKKVLPKEIQIKMATQVAPEEDREGAKVWGYNEEGEMVVLQEGTNNIVCLADNPNKEGIKVSCYGKQLEPFMKRGRDLKAEGKATMELREIREKEAKSGELRMPEAPSMLYVLTGSEKDLDIETGMLRKSDIRYVIYTPFATLESTGLPAKPHKPGMPWLMDPGTHRAHIMVTPPKE